MFMRTTRSWDFCCTYMYSRCAEWTAAALPYRHRTMTDDSTSRVASNYREEREISPTDELLSM